MDWSHGTNPYSGLPAPGSGFPSILPLSEATDYVADCPASSVVLGVDSSGTPVTVDLDGESPHVLVSAPTGAGKSAVARSIAVQRLARGDIVVFLDVKRHSHRWARKLAPNVHYAPSIQDIGGALYNLGRELHRRNEVVEAWEGPLESAPVGPRVIVVFEEMNATMRQLRELDRRLPDGDYRASDGLMDLSFMGRAVRMHLISFAQLATYRASGGSEIVENYGTKIMIQYSPQAWRYLASDCGRPVTAPAEDGRAIVAAKGKAREVQLLWVPEEDAQPFVTASVPAQRTARALSPSARLVPEVWRTAIANR